MTNGLRKTALIVGGLVVAGGLGAIAMAQDRPGFRDTPRLPGSEWRVHDADRPEPEVVAPGVEPGAPPADAVILFDGRALDAFARQQRPWAVADGAMTVVPKQGDEPENALVTRQSFGSVQLHLEYRMPDPPQGDSQDRGNSGVWFMQRYEVQILDGHENPTYADGTVGAIYGVAPPLVNASRAPGEWQSYDIIFERPIFGAGGQVVRPAMATVFLNGVLVQNRTPFLGTTVWRQIGSYQPHGDAAPIQLQDHGTPVSYRNIWVRPIADPTDLTGQEAR